MKIYVKNNRIVCSLENKNSNFWYGAEYKYFVGGVRYDTRYALVRSMDYQYKTLREASDDLKTLTDMLRDAERHNIEIDEAVYEWRKRLQSKVSELLVIDQAAKDKIKRREQWELKCKHGCGRCPNLCYYVDDPICKATGKSLETKNEPCYNVDDGIYYMFNFVPYPSEDCPMNPKEASCG